MKFKFLIAVMLLAAMGPGRSDPAPEAVVTPDPPAAPAPAPEPAAPVTQDLRILDADEAEPGDFLWTARPLIVFADTGDDPAFTQQMRSIRERPGSLVERDVVVITDTDPAANSVWRRDLRPRGFSLVLMDKDGQVKQRKPSPWDVREITRAIDKFPLRRQEIGRAGVLP